MGRGNDIIEDKNDDLVPEDERSTMAEQKQLCLDDDGYRNVRNMSLDLFRRKLVDHFDIMHRQNTTSKK
jgi:hypothetical protein